MKKYRISRHLPILCLLLCGMALPAYGQQDTIITRLKEVAVVGQKQDAEADLSAVTIMSAKALNRLNVVAMRGMGEIAPNFYIPQYGSRMTSTIYVRGLGARIDQPAVGLNVDGVPYLNKDSYDFDIFDIDKIEVFRGAQSILNGRNTMCGQVNIFTLSPWRFEGLRLMAEYGRANSVKAAVGYYSRLSSKLASALSVYYTMTDGYYRNEYNNGRLDHEKQGSARWKLSWHPSSRLSVTNAASAQITRQGGYPYQSLKTGDIAFNDTCYYRRTSFADGLTLGWSSKRVVVTSVTSMQYIDDDVTLDQDFTRDPYFTLTQKRKEWALTEDLYTRGHRGAYSWLGGVFGFYRNSSMQAPVTFKNDGVANLIEKYPNQINPYYPIQWDSREFVLGSEFDTKTRGFAIYQQSKYALGNWDFELGLRWDIEWATLDYHSHCNTGYTTWHVLPDGTREQYSHTPLDINEQGTLNRTFSQLLPKIAVGYNISNTRIYANVAKGYKAGGYNSQMFSDVLQQKLMAMMGLGLKYDVDEMVGYKPEKSWNYEVGFKSDLLGSRLKMNGCIFYISCIDQQLTKFPDGLTTGRMMTNAGRTRSYGAELSAVWQPADDLILQCSYGHTNATFRKYDNGKADFRGKKLPYAPSNTIFASCTYYLPFSLGDSKIYVEANVRGIGDIYWDEANTVHQPLYALLNASAGLEKDNYSIKVWGNNLTSTSYDTFYFVSMGNAFVQKGLPWSVGVTLRGNFRIND